MDEIKRMKKHIKWCNEFLENCCNHNTYDPVKTLSEQEIRDQELIILCCEYIYGIDEILKRSSSLFEAKRNEIVFNERSGQC